MNIRLVHKARTKLTTSELLFCTMVLSSDRFGSAAFLWKRINPITYTIKWVKYLKSLENGCQACCETGWVDKCILEEGEFEL